uniref:Heterochromatin protein 1-binding protein 3 n=1 Tax=Latimeria chalumnae TaxID=7897 RepID=H3BEL5_LATCH
KLNESAMPIRRSTGASVQEPKPTPAAGEEEKADPDVSSEESVSAGEEQENEAPAATSNAAESKKQEETEEKKEETKSSETKKDEKDPGKEKEKEKKVKKTIPSWATLSASQLARAQKSTTMSAASRPKMDAILTEAIKACFQKSGASVVAIRKYIINKYPSLDLENRGYLLKQALKRELQRGIIKQVKGKGASGSFAVVPSAAKPVLKAKGDKRKSVTTTTEQPAKLEDALPLAFTRLCEPKEASYSLIKKYVTQYYPKLKVESSLHARPQLLKNALQRAVEKGQLEQITGKGASGTFQLKRVGDKPLLGGGPFEDAILSAITAMNEPKTSSTTALKKYVVENFPAPKNNLQVHMLKKTLQKCEKNGWMEQISGKGFSGTYMLCFPYYPSPSVLFPDKHKEEDEEEESESEEEESEEEESEESESEEDEPPAKKRMQKSRKAPARGKPKATPPKRREPVKKRAPPKKEPPKSSPKKPKLAPPAKAKSPKKPQQAAKKSLSRSPKKAAKPAAKAKPNSRHSQRMKI